MENQEMRFCQSCAMPLDQDELRGTEADGSLSPDYCKYCYQNGAFTREQTMEQAIENDLPFVLKAGVYAEILSYAQAVEAGGLRRLAHGNKL